jgi:hypothetical protein
MLQVCWSVPRHAGLPPISTVVAHAPRSGEPCIVESPSRAAGLPTVDALVQRMFVGIRKLHDALYAEQRIAEDLNGVARVD